MEGQAVADEGTSTAPQVEESHGVLRSTGGSWWLGLKQGAELGRETFKWVLSPLAVGTIGSLG